MREFSSETSDLENEELLVKDRKISNAAIMTSSEKLSMILRLKKFMIPLAIVYYAEYVINSGVNGTVGFEDMQPHDFYVLAGLVYQIGVFLSRSSGSIFPISVLWPLPVFQMLNLVYFVLQSMTGLIPLKQIVFLIVFWEGLLGGATCKLKLCQHSSGCVFFLSFFLPPSFGVSIIDVDKKRGN